MSLSYDATFLSIFLDGYSTKLESCQFRCLFVPFGRRRELKCNIAVLDYAALINGYLFVKKLEDNFCDDKNWLCGIVSFLLKKTARYRNFRTNHEKLFLTLENCYFQYMNAEKNQLFCSADEYIGLFGDFLGEVYQGIFEYSQEGFEDKKIKQNLFIFGKIIGMWIYTIDALDDYEIDKKRHKFNPLMYMKEDTSTLPGKVEKMLILMQTDLFIRFKEIESNTNGEIIKNILTYGMRRTMDNVMKGWKNEGI